MVKILFIGDIVGKPGRKALKEVLPQWKKKYKPDVVIANVENLAHGKGVTPSTLAEIDQPEIDCFTSGNHIFKKGDLSSECFEKYPKLIRPANFGDSLPGHGYFRFAKNGPASPEASQGGQQYLVINLNGQVFMEKQFDGPIDNPFLAIDKILSLQSQKSDIIIVDFHAEATSEKVAMGFYLEGRVSAVIGTHTHVQTADDRILPKGTAYISDVGMTGARDGIIGVKKELILTRFLDPNQKFINEPEEEGVMQVCGVLIGISKNGKAKKIKRVHQEIPN
jgi:hypothetical protein